MSDSIASWAVDTSKSKKDSGQIFYGEGGQFVAFFWRTCSRDGDCFLYLPDPKVWRTHYTWAEGLKDEVESRVIKFFADWKGPFASVEVEMSGIATFKKHSTATAVAMSELAYIAHLNHATSGNFDLQDIRRAIAARGFWEESSKWGPLCEAKMRIDPIQHAGQTWFRAGVMCGHEFFCNCPTVQRAVQFLGIYQHLIFDMYNVLGSPTCAEKQENNTQ